MVAKGLNRSAHLILTDFTGNFHQFSLPVSKLFTCSTVNDSRLTTPFLSCTILLIRDLYLIFTQIKADDGVRPGTTMEVLKKLKPAFKDGGSTTAGWYIVNTP